MKTKLVILLALVVAVLSANAQSTSTGMNRPDLVTTQIRPLPWGARTTPFTFTNCATPFNPTYGAGIWIVLTNCPASSNLRIGIDLSPDGVNWSTNQAPTEAPLMITIPFTAQDSGASKTYYYSLSPYSVYGAGWFRLGHATNAVGAAVYVDKVYFSRRQY